MNEKSKVELLLFQFSRQIYHRRRELGLSQQELADRCGLHRTYISDVERGERNMSLKTLFNIAFGLETSASEIMLVAEEKYRTAKQGGTKPKRRAVELEFDEDPKLEAKMNRATSNLRI